MTGTRTDQHPAQISESWSRSLDDSRSSRRLDQRPVTSYRAIEWTRRQSGFDGSTLAKTAGPLLAIRAVPVAKKETRMLTRTGAYLCEQRLAHRLTRGQLAAALGYTNIAKGANRIVHLERDGMAIDGLLDKVVHVLGLDQQHVQELFHEDRRRFEEDWQRWASEPIEPQLRFRPFAGLWCGESLPKNFSKDEAVEFARTRATERRLIYILIWSRQEDIWCYPDGTTRARIIEVGEVAGPDTTLRGRGNRGFIFG